jgi:hypothetical protein
MVRGRVEIDEADGLTSEYVTSAERYFGGEQGEAWLNQARPIMPRMARPRVQPEWVGILDFEQRFTSALVRAMSRAPV